MAATAQLVRPALKTEEITEAECITCVKNVLGMSIGCISYLRCIFDPSNFYTVTLGNIKLRSLKKGVSEKADDLIDWITLGVFDALEKRYLRAFVFGFYSDKDAPEKLTECYTFHVKYPKEDGTEFDLAIEQGGDAFAALRSKDGISTATKQMLGNLLEKVRSLKPIKGFCGVTVRLYYYDDVTPLEYEPPCFRRSQTQRPYFDGQPTLIKVGVDEDNAPLKTPYHELSLSIQSVLAAKDGDKENAQPAESVDHGKDSQSTRARSGMKKSMDDVAKQSGDEENNNEDTHAAPIQESQALDYNLQSTLPLSAIDPHSQLLERKMSLMALEAFGQTAGSMDDEFLSRDTAELISELQGSQKPATEPTASRITPPQTVDSKRANANAETSQGPLTKTSSGNSSGGLSVAESLDLMAGMDDENVEPVVTKHEEPPTTATPLLREPSQAPTPAQSKRKKSKEELMKQMDLDQQDSVLRQFSQKSPVRVNVRPPPLVTVPTVLLDENVENEAQKENEENVCVEDLIFESQGRVTRTKAKELMGVPIESVDLASTVVSQGKTSDCVCGIDRTTEQLIACSTCHHSAHAVCHGIQDAAILTPEALLSFQCYKCQPNLDQAIVSETITLRRVLDHVCKNGFKRIADIPKETGVTLHDAKQIIERLGNEGVLTKSAAKKSGRGRAKAPVWELCDTAAVMERREFYFSDTCLLGDVSGAVDVVEEKADAMELDVDHHELDEKANDAGKTSKRGREEADEEDEHSQNIDAAYSQQSDIFSYSQATTAPRRSKRRKVSVPAKNIHFDL